jgi:predicted nucleotidyltransferase
MDLAALKELAAQQQAARNAAAHYAGRIRTDLGSRVQWIRLYGSLARGDWMGPDESDVDVAIVVEGKTAADINRIIRLGTDEMLRTGFVFSPRVFTPEEFQELVDRELRLARDILGEGRLL